MDRCRTCLAARQELIGLDITPGDERVGHVGRFADASEPARQAIELSWVGPAVNGWRLAQRSGIKVSPITQYDPSFSVVRELHRGIRATTASVELGITDENAFLDAADDGVGVTSEDTSVQLHRARVDAAGRAVFLATGGTLAMERNGGEIGSGVPVAAT